jgi:undecaprenyl-diphosphatase
MLFVKTLLLGLLEGITEFLPVSSTAHLIVFAQVLKLPSSDYWKFFEVFIQSGAILAVLTIYWRKLLNRELLTKLVFSFVPTAVFGFVLYKIVKGVFFESNLLIAISLICFGLFFLVLEARIKNKQLVLKKEIKNLSLVEATVLGLCQAAAMVPGVSRAGAVLVGGLLMGYKRSEVALYSFFLAVPTILAASGYDLLKTNPAAVFTNIPLTITGFVSAYLSALVVIKWLIGYLQAKNLELFAYYRISLGLIIFILSLFYA